MNCTDQSPDGGDLSLHPTGSSELGVYAGGGGGFEVRDFSQFFAIFRNFAQFFPQFFRNCFRPIHFACLLVPFAFVNNYGLVNGLVHNLLM